MSASSSTSWAIWLVIAILLAVIVGLLIWIIIVGSNNSKSTQCNSIISIKD